MLITVQIIGVDPEGSLMAQPDSLNPRTFQPYELEVLQYLPVSTLHPVPTSQDA
jgi:hypothetical protein